MPKITDYKKYNKMKKTFAILGSAVLLLFAFLMTSCSLGQKAKVVIDDGEIQWPSIKDNRIMTGHSEDGTPAMWGPFFQTEVCNSLRSLGFSVFTCEPGTYSSVYDPATQKWSDPVIGHVSLNVDYDGIAYPTWHGRSAVVTIHRFNKRAKRLDATFEAVVMKEGTTETRNIKVEVTNLDVSGK